MKYPSALRAYRTSPVAASVTSTPHAPLSGPAAASAASARCRKRSTSARPARLPSAAPLCELGGLDGRDCAVVYAAPAQTTMPKTTHPPGKAGDLRSRVIEPLPWGIRNEKLIIVHTVARTGNECGFPNLTRNSPAFEFFGRRQPA